MARTPLIAGNWKMNTTVAEAQELTGAMLAGLDQIRAWRNSSARPSSRLLP